MRMNDYSSLRRYFPFHYDNLKKKKKQQNIAVALFLRFAYFVWLFSVTFKCFETGLSLPVPFALLGYFLKTVFFPTLMLINTWQGTILCRLH